MNSNISAWFIEQWGRIRHDLSVVSAQWDDYWFELVNVVIPGIKNAPEDARLRGRSVVLHTLHKCHAVVSEQCKRMWRLNSYLFYVRFPLTLTGICTMYSWATG